MSTPQATIKRLEEENASLKRDLEIESRIAGEYLNIITRARSHLPIIRGIVPESPVEARQLVDLLAAILEG